MPDSNSNLDIGGLGEVVNAIPKEGWKTAIDTACNSFSDLIAPITKTTAGLGGLIQAKFDAMIDVQKVFATDAVHRAREKLVHVEAKPNARPNARVLITAIEQASVESDDSLRDIWANLIANELASGNTHPDFPRILCRLSARDAIVLSQIAERSKKKSIKSYAIALAASLKVYGFSISALLSEEADANREHLNTLALIKKTDGLWVLTCFGEEFVGAVTDPSLPPG